MLKGVAAGAGGIAVGQFALANSAFAAGGGTAGSAGVVVSGRHLSFVPAEDGTLRNAMAVTAQLVSKTGVLPRNLRAYVEVGTAPGHYGERYDADIQHLIGQYLDLAIEPSLLRHVQTSVWPAPGRAHP